MNPGAVLLDVDREGLALDAPADRSVAMIRAALAPIRSGIVGAVGAPVRVTVEAGVMRVDVPALDALAPEMVRALAPDLPSVDTWPPSWRELFEERASIAAESGATDAEALATAEAELRVAVWRGDVEAVEACA